MVNSAARRRFGRIPFMIIGNILFAMLTYPLFYFLTLRPQFLHLILLQTVLGILMTMFSAPMPALLSELFPVHARGTGMSLSYPVMIFGGFTGMTITWLIAITGHKLVICFYVVGGAMISIAATLGYRLQLK